MDAEHGSGAEVPTTELVHLGDDILFHLEIFPDQAAGSIDGQDLVVIPAEIQLDDGADPDEARTPIFRTPNAKEGLEMISRRAGIGVGKSEPGLDALFVAVGHDLETPREPGSKPDGASNVHPEHAAARDLPGAQGDQGSLKGEPELAPAHYGAPLVVASL